MDNVVCTYTKDGAERRILVELDPEPTSPREMGENFGTLHLAHKKYRLPAEGRPEDKGLLQNDCIVLPVWGYDHSGLFCKAGERTYPFTDQWDSGLLGYVWAPKGKEGLTDQKIKETLEAEVAEFNQYLSGQVYGYVIQEKTEWKNSKTGEAKTTWETKESCWGFYDLEECKKQAMAQDGVKEPGNKKEKKGRENEGMGM